SSRRRHTRSTRDWSSDVCSSDLDDRRPGLVWAALRRGASRGDCGMGLGDWQRGAVRGAVARCPESAETLANRFRAAPGERANGRSEERRVGKEGKVRGERWLVKE